jgi:tetratricopeptide (TPR) repeat protein
LAWSILHYDFDYWSAVKEFQRAIAINPNYATAHQWYGHCLAYMACFEEARLETAHALELDPLSLIIHTSHAAVFWVSRQWDDAIHLCHRGLELDSSFAGLHWLLANVYQAKGGFDEAILERQRVVEFFAGAPFAVAELGGTYAAAGEATKARRILEQLHGLAKGIYVSAHAFALIHAVRG